MPDPGPAREERTAVSIVFSPPESDALSRHERTIEGIPRSVVEAMIEDHRAYGTVGLNASPHQLYRYEEGGEERMIALDYTEVVDLFGA